ncbi:MAG: tRNA (N6-threonylcarbamoyladenosine(37)-N6)-methyltransferase TrmO [Myxococcales bacterium]
MAHKSARWNGQAISVSPIGIFRSPFRERMDAPRQARVAAETEGRVELFEGQGYEDALSDLDRFDHLWLVFWFDRNVGFRPKVLPPRSAVKRGVFATRAPYRPNPIGLSAVELVGIEGLTVHVRGVDLLDGTPVLDLKPYVPYSDAIPQASHGWLELPTGQGERPRDPLPAYAVTFAPLAEQQLAFLRDEQGLELGPRVEEVLRLGPTPHAYRRIRREPDGPEGAGYVLALKDWRVRFSAQGEQITVVSLHSGYRPSQLFSEPAQAPEVHRAFVAKWATLLP